MIKRIISIASIIAGALMLLSCVTPMLIGAILEIQMQSHMAETVEIIGGADGPTAVMVPGVKSVGHAVTEIVIGSLLIVVGIRCLRKNKKSKITNRNIKSSPERCR